MDTGTKANRAGFAHKHGANMSYFNVNKVEIHIFRRKHVLLNFPLVASHFCELKRIVTVHIQVNPDTNTQTSLDVIEHLFVAASVEACKYFILFPSEL